MPITFMCACTVFFGLALLVPAVPISLILLSAGKKRLATAILSIPAGMIGLAVLLTIFVFTVLWFHGVRMSSHPDLLFKETLGFEPPPQTQVLNGYCNVGQDYAMTVLKFHTPKDVTDQIATNKFIRSDREACVGNYDRGFSDLPERVRSWFPPPQEPSMQWYVAESSDGTFGPDEAVLCYDEDAQIAYFHWVCVD
jgi:hypothetical protein